MDIGEAIQLMREGDAVRRRGWNGKGQWLRILEPRGIAGIITLPFIYIKTVQGDKVPWLASQTDILAKDWEVAND